MEGRPLCWAHAANGLPSKFGGTYVQTQGIARRVPGEITLSGVALRNNLFAQASKARLPPLGATTSGTAIHNRA